MGLFIVEYSGYVKVFFLIFYVKNIISLMMV